MTRKETPESGQPATTISCCHGEERKSPLVITTPHPPTKTPRPFTSLSQPKSPGKYPAPQLICCIHSLRSWESRRGKKTAIEQEKGSQQAMGCRRPCFLLLLLIVSPLCLSITHGYARNIKIMRTFSWGVHGDASAEGEEVVVLTGKGREMAEVDLTSAVDYPQPGANTNPRAGSFWGAPPPPAPKQGMH
ncbi:hypothetical protein Taro_036149 [Colocasia esculenta]|uniref:Uncharacterized protein n=1 Tax=Colocasia esculenta TaxID=4460 RepID=A0A843W8U8_COLES|nr:hypothetical protein [Colocasia esculenta]